MTTTENTSAATSVGKTPAFIGAVPVLPSTGVLRPLGLDEVSITGGFWGRYQSVNADATLEHIRYWLEQTGWLPNFDLAAAGTLPAGRQGREFSDSEIYKYLEAMAWELGRHDDLTLEQQFRSVVDRVGAAQEPDGYLNTRFGRVGQEPRWSDLEWGHELYCTGHLIQAAVARERTRPGADDGLLAIAVRAADLVCDTFGHDGIQSVCGHAEVETALVELGRVTGNNRYVEQARLFVERRGTGVLADIEYGRGYFQDDVPVRESEALHGHAVRANYFASGAADVAAEYSDTDLVDSLARQWRRTVNARTYVTGGQGSHHQDESFGVDFELPPDRAYSETCAGIASVQFSWRMLLSHGDSSYADLIERTLYNVVATSPSESGTKFYYANTLHQRTAGIETTDDELSPRASSSLRSPWFEVSCCPTNVARTMASLDAYVATANGSGIQIHQFATATVSTILSGGESVRLEMETDYPAAGVVGLRIVSAPSTEWTLSVRVPNWAEGAQLSLESSDGTTSSDVTPGYATVRRLFLAGDVVRLSLPMSPRIVAPDPRVDAIRGCVAIERGPEVYALESTDLSPELAEAGLDGLYLDLGEEPAYEEGQLTVGLALRGAVGEAAAERVALVRYHDWAERGPSTMRVWIPTS